VIVRQHAAEQRIYNLRATCVSKARADYPRAFDAERAHGGQGKMQIMRSSTQRVKQNGVPVRLLYDTRAEEVRRRLAQGSSLATGAPPKNSVATRALDALAFARTFPQQSSRDKTGDGDIVIPFFAHDGYQGVHHARCYDDGTLRKPWFNVTLRPRTLALRRVVALATDQLTGLLAGTANSHGGGEYTRLRDGVTGARVDSLKLLKKAIERKGGGVVLCLPLARFYPTLTLDEDDVAIRKCVACGNEFAKCDNHPYDLPCKGTTVHAADFPRLPVRFAVDPATQTAARAAQLVGSASECSSHVHLCGLHSTLRMQISKSMCNFTQLLQTKKKQKKIFLYRPRSSAKRRSGTSDGNNDCGSGGSSCNKRWRRRAPRCVTSSNQRRRSRRSGDDDAMKNWTRVEARRRYARPRPRRRRLRPRRRRRLRSRSGATQKRRRARRRRRRERKRTATRRSGGA
jgi:hypothetical protein